MEICCHHDLQDNNIAALEHRDRICEMDLYLPSLEYGKLAKLTQLQNPFPELTCLRLRCRGFEPVAALPVTFLGGSAPSLRSFQLEGIPFPTLPQFLLSCNDLSELYLQNIPDLGYIPPEAMVTVLSALTKLKCLEIGFKQPGEIRLAPPPPPPLTRSVLQSLTVLRFYDHGVKKYSEDLLSRIDVPHLETLSMVYEYDPHVFDILQLISHSLRLGPFHRAEVTFRFISVNIRLYQSVETDSPKKVELCFIQYAPGYQAAYMAQIRTLSPLLSSVTKLDIRSDRSFERLDKRDVMNLRDNSQWLVLFHLFASVRTLCFSGDIQPFVVSFIASLLPGRTTEVLPELQNLYLTDRDWRDELEEQAIELFIAAGQNSDHSVTVHRLPYRDCSDSEPFI
jgi:hypothetical protein